MFLNFPLRLQLLINITETQCLEKKNVRNVAFLPKQTADSWSRRFPCFPLAESSFSLIFHHEAANWKPLWHWEMHPEGLQDYIFGHFSACLQCILRVVLRVSNTHWSLPEGLQCPLKSLTEPLDAFCWYL